jgi:hypothetical protein
MDAPGGGQVAQPFERFAAEILLDLGLNHPVKPGSPVEHHIRPVGGGPSGHPWRSCAQITS